MLYLGPRCCSPAVLLVHGHEAPSDVPPRARPNLPNGPFLTSLGPLDPCLQSDLTDAEPPGLGETLYHLCGPQGEFKQVTA